MSSAAVEQVINQTIACSVHDAIYPVVDGRMVFAQAWADGWRIPEPVPVDEWADTYRVLPRASSSEPGPWRTSRTPYLREPMQVLSDSHPSKRVIMIFGTQTGKTETGNNWVGSSIHQSPSSMMVVQPTVEMGKRWTRQRLNPMIELTPELQECIKPVRSRDSGNTMTMKEYPGGFLVIAGSNSAASLSSMPVRRLFVDEVDRCASDVDGEGHSVDVASRRTSSFPRRKELLTSTPTVKGESVIEEEYELSDQRHYYVPCPHCGHKQILHDENLTDDGTYLCEKGGHEIEEHHKTKMLADGEWRAHNPESDIPGFHLPSYYAPIGLGYSWKEIAELRAKAKKNPEKWKTYVNTIMAETYEDESGRVEWKDVKDRAGNYSSRTIPLGCLMLTAGIDVQDDRFAVVIYGWGRGEKIWAIDYFELPVNPGIDKEWNILDEKVLDVTFVNQFGIEMKVLSAGLDTGGHYTHMAYNYARKRKHRRVLAMKGSSFKNKPIIATRPSPKDVDVRGKIIRAGVDLWNIGTDTAKGAIFAKLHADEGAEPVDYRYNSPGDLGDDFYQQLTAERYDTTKQKWVKPRHKRNEVLDCTVYAYAAACHPAIRVHMLRDKDWEKIEAKIQPVIKDLFGGQAPEPANQQTEKEIDEHVIDEQTEQDSQQHQPKPKPRKKRGKGSFVGGNR
jgi:phage terminase large subunit GpA-like protein